MKLDQLRRGLTLILLALLAPLSQSKADDANLADHVAHDLLRVMGQCPQRVWQGYDWFGLNAVVIGADPREAKAVSVRTGKVWTVPESSIPARAQNGFYSFYSRLRLQWVSINERWYLGMDPSAKGALDNYIFGVIIHESFHHVVQPHWEGHEKQAQRGTTYPMLLEPRLQRRMLFERLLEAFENPRGAEASLAKAKFWYDEWVNAYPDEVAQSHDAAEGTAQMVTVVAQSLRARGCEATEADIRNDLLPAVRELRRFVSESTFAVDDEAYAVGTLANLLLRFDIGGNWQREIERGRSPIEVLLAGRASMKDEVDQLIYRDREKTFVAKTKEVAPILDHILARFDSPTAVFVSLPQPWIKWTSYDNAGFFVLKDKNLNALVLGSKTSFEPGGDRPLVTLDGGAVVLEGAIPSPCALESWGFVAVDRESLVVKDGDVEINDVSLRAHYPGKLLKSADGRTWLCGI